MPASLLESEILPARIDGYDPADLDAVAAAGEVVWVGVESLGERDGRVALYLADHLARLLPPRDDTVRLQPRETLRLNAPTGTCDDQAPHGPRRESGRPCPASARS